MLKWFFYILSTSHIFDRSCWSDSHCHVESCRGDHFDKNPDCGDFRNGLLERVYDKLEITKWSNVAVSNRLDSKVSLCHKIVVVPFNWRVTAFYFLMYNG